MIKVTLGEVKPQEEKPFPKLMKHNNSDLIVLFQRYKEGVVLYSGSGHEVGENSKTWNIENFTDYNEPITIQNA